MRICFCFLLCWLLSSFCCLAQKEGNFWMFGYCNSINFNGGSPVYGGVPGTGNSLNTNISFNRANAIADTNGRLLFYVKLAEHDSRIPSNASIYNANGDPMVNSELAIATPIRGPVQIIKRPGSDFIYYVVYSLNYALLSTTVDMRLNNGLGGVVAAEKSVFLSGWQTVVGEKTAVIQGCNGLWLVVRSRTDNQYLSFKVTAEGINKRPVISEVGLLPMNAYGVSSCNFIYGYHDGYGGMTREKQVGWAGALRASPDGLNLVAACCGGLELYDFSKCSGQLANPVLIDTVNTIEVNYTPYCGFRTGRPNVTFHSACFSPDNSKLYATYYLFPYVFQYDLSVAREQIIRTKTRVLTNQPTRTGCRNICMFIDTIGIDDLKLGPDGKIYIPNNGHPPCQNSSISNVGHMKDYALHVINSPNLPGLACNPQHNALVLGPLDETGSRFQTYHNFNPPIVLPPSLPDTLAGQYQVSLCKGGILKADSSGDCYQWSNGVTDTHAIRVNASGIYVAKYFKNCTYHMDSFWVAIPPFPEVASLQYSCPGELSIRVKQREGDTCSYQYTLHYATGDSSTGSGVDGYIFQGLDAGLYTLHVQSAQGCDTSYFIQLVSYPTPTMETEPWDTTIVYGDAVLLQARGAVLYAWSPAATLSNPLIPDPIARPKERTLYRVIGTNDYGCKDTGYIMVRLDYGLPDMLPNAFSPNGDGLNDAFKLEGITYQQLNFFKVFNRFGQLVFYTTDIHKGWNGTYREQVCDAGTYYYQVELVYPDGRVKRVKGDVFLLR